MCHFNFITAPASSALQYAFHYITLQCAISISLRPVCIQYITVCITLHYITLQCAISISLPPIRKNCFKSSLCKMWINATKLSCIQQMLSPLKKIRKINHISNLWHLSDDPTPSFLNRLIKCPAEGNLQILQRKVHKLDYTLPSWIRLLGSSDHLKSALCNESFGLT